VDNLRIFDLPGSGLKCGNAECGETLPRVARTITTDGFITRERICPACGMVNTTSERVINTREKRTYFSRSGQ